MRAATIRRAVRDVNVDISRAVVVLFYISHENLVKATSQRCSRALLGPPFFMRTLDRGRAAGAVLCIPHEPSVARDLSSSEIREGDGPHAKNQQVRVAGTLAHWP